MQLYIPLDQKPYGDFSETKLFFSPIYNSSPKFYQIICSSNERNILTRENLDSGLATRNVQPMDFFDLYSKNAGARLTVVLPAVFITAILYGTVTGRLLSDDFEQKNQLCSRRFSLYNTIENKSEIVSLSYPCYKKVLIHDGSWLGPVIGSCTVVATIIAIVIVCGMNFFKKRVYNDSVDRFTANLSARIKQLSYAVNLKEEVKERDVGLIFPYLTDKELPLLKFSHLRKAKKNWETVFQQKLDASLFSKQQLIIWRLFQRFLNGDNKTQCRILKEPKYAAIIGSEPLFFQEIIWKIGLLKTDDKKVALLCDILEDKILTLKAALLFEKKDLISTVISVSERKALKLMISHHIKNVKRKNSNDDFFPEILDNKIDKTLTGRFKAFLETGKLKVRELSDYYEFLKLAKSNDHKDIAKWLEAHLSNQLAEFLKLNDLGPLIKEIDEFNINSLKHKIDHHLESTWGAQENISDYLSDDFTTKYTFATDYGLTLLTKCLENHFKDHVKEFSFEFPFSGHDTVSSIHRILDKCEYLLGDDKQEVILLLKDKIVAALYKNPEIIETLADAVEESDSQWLKEIMSNVYKEDSSHFSMYWLTPFENTALIEVI